MSETTVVLEIDKPHLIVRLYENLLKIDLKGTVKNEIEEALENKPILRETIGRFLGIFVPLHIHLSDIDSVKMDEKGRVEISLPRHTDIVVPLEPKDAKILVDKLNELIPIEREKELERIMKEQKLQKIEEAERELTKEEIMIPMGGATVPVPAPPGVVEREKEAEKRIIEDEEK